MQPTTLVAIAAAVIFVIVRQVRPRRISALQLIGLPLIFLLLTADALRRGVGSGATVPIMVASLCLAVAGGWWQGAVTTVFSRDGRWYMRGGPRYLVAWAILIALRLGLEFLAGGLTHGRGLSATTWLIWAEMTAVWGARSVTLCLRRPEILAGLSRSRA